MMQVACAPGGGATVRGINDMWRMSARDDVSSNLQVLRTVPFDNDRRSP